MKKEKNNQSWLEIPANSEFSMLNIPFGVIRNKFGKVRCATRIGDFAIDLNALADYSYFDDLDLSDITVFKQESLNAFIDLGRPAWKSVRKRIIEIFSPGSEMLRHEPEEKDDVLHHISEVKELMPVFIRDYTDFYSSMQHAVNVGKMFRDPDKALLPNWKHIPVGYHGRASSIFVSGTRVHRPKGQILPAGSDTPLFGPTQSMDFELEMAFISAHANKPGEPIPVEKAEDHIFGLVLFNDLSARDIQKWEYVPLGPFQGKSFASVISPWVVTLEALEPFRIDGPVQDPEVLPYLGCKGKRSFDIELEVFLRQDNGQETRVCQSNMKHLYWNMAQQLAHQTANGCNISTGDLYASGTISGPEASSFGSMLELSWNGTKPIRLQDGTERKYIRDYDTIVMKGFNSVKGQRIGFGECSVEILPSV
ncbi:MAG: fumarylacetoacetase [Bacteroidales bacterium]|nr:fumarylacetoacetase [Bacteroidales bacterium]